MQQVKMQKKIKDIEYASLLDEIKVGLFRSINVSGI
jgi:hypothetical protein